MTARRAPLPDPIAPWAESVLGAPYPMTMDAFLAYPDKDGCRFELVEGVLVSMVGSHPIAGHITVRLQSRLAIYVEEHGLGPVAGPDEPYDFESTGQKDTGLLPDIGFYNASREALVDPHKAYPFAPDLAIEVASPQHYRPGMQVKAQRYLAGGTALVWVIWPQRLQVDVWRLGASSASTLGVDDLLDGEDVIQGFTYPVARLFT